MEVPRDYMPEPPTSQTLPYFRNHPQGHPTALTKESQGLIAHYRVQLGIFSTFSKDQVTPWCYIYNNTGRANCNRSPDRFYEFDALIESKHKLYDEFHNEIFQWTTAGVDNGLHRCIQVLAVKMAARTLCQTYKCPFADQWYLWASNEVEQAFNDAMMEIVSDAPTGQYVDIVTSPVALPGTARPMMGQFDQQLPGHGGQVAGPAYQHQPNALITDDGPSMFMDLDMPAPGFQQHGISNAVLRNQIMQDMNPNAYQYAGQTTMPARYHHSQLVSMHDPAVVAQQTDMVLPWNQGYQHQDSSVCSQPQQHLQTGLLTPVQHANIEQLGVGSQVTTTTMPWDQGYQHQDLSVHSQPQQHQQIELQTPSQYAIMHQPGLGSRATAPILPSNQGVQHQGMPVPIPRLQRQKTGLPIPIPRAKMASISQSQPTDLTVTTTSGAFLDLMTKLHHFSPPCQQRQDATGLVRPPVRDRATLKSLGVLPHKPSSFAPKPPERGRSHLLTPKSDEEGSSALGSRKAREEDSVDAGTAPPRKKMRTQAPADGPSNRADGQEPGGGAALAGSSTGPSTELITIPAQLTTDSSDLMSRPDDKGLPQQSQIIDLSQWIDPSMIAEPEIDWFPAGQQAQAVIPETDGRKAIGIVNTTPMGNEDHSADIHMTEGSAYDNFPFFDPSDQAMDQAESAQEPRVSDSPFLNPVTPTGQSTTTMATMPKIIDGTRSSVYDAEVSSTETYAAFDAAETGPSNARPEADRSIQQGSHAMSSEPLPEKYPGYVAQRWGGVRGVGVDK